MWWDNIDYDLEAQGGKPVVKGNGIPVEVVLERLSVEPTMQSVLGAYPGLTEQDVKACLQYAQTCVANIENYAEEIDGEPGDWWEYSIYSAVQPDGTMVYKPRLWSRRSAFLPDQQGQLSPKWHHTIRYESIDGYPTVEEAKLGVKHLMEHEKISDYFDFA